MEPSSCAKPASAAQRDLLRGGSWLLWWGLPIVAIVAGAFWPAARPLLWTAGMGVAGAACVVNAHRCGRRHCFFTGPIFLVGALASLLNGLGATALPWNGILAAVVIGCLGACGLECWRGAYIRPAR